MNCDTRIAIHTVFFSILFPNICYLILPFDIANLIPVLFFHHFLSLFLHNNMCKKYLQTAQGHTLRPHNKLKILNIISTSHFIGMVMRHFTKHYKVPYVEGLCFCNDAKIRDELIIKTVNLEP